MYMYLVFILVVVVVSMQSHLILIDNAVHNNYKNKGINPQMQLLEYIPTLNT